MVFGLQDTGDAEQEAAKICVRDLTAEPGNYFTRFNSILFYQLKAKLKPINLPTEQGRIVQGVKCARPRVPRCPTASLLGSARGDSWAHVRVPWGRGCHTASGHLLTLKTRISSVKD